MQYMLMLYANETKAMPTGSELATLIADYGRFTAGIAENGHLLAAVRLAPSASATTVREKMGKRLTDDGPCTESKVHLSGYYLVECKNLDEAIAIAGRVPGVRLGEAVEVRPVLPAPEGRGAASS